jgi:hypothetical protein
MDRLGHVLRKCLAEGKSVEIDGLGEFVPDAEHGYRFQPLGRPKVFLAYVLEDVAKIEQIFDQLAASGFDPWMDRRKLLPGQNWPRAIERAIETSDFFLGCFSRHSVGKRGGFPAEIHYALECARRIPLDEIFIIPVRLDPCPVPGRIQSEIQYIDLFRDWQRGLRTIVEVMQSELARRRSRGREFRPELRML